MARYSGSRKNKRKDDKKSSYTNRNGEKVERSGWGPDRNRIQKDPAFKGFLLQQTEFTDCIAACKLFRRTFLPFVSDAMDNRVTPRITKLMSNIKNLDPGKAGERKVFKGLEVTGS